MIKFNIKKYDYVDSKITGEVQRFRINAPNEKSTFPAGKGKWGLLDWRGEVLVEAIYDKINPFKEHLALTKKGKKYGYLDDRGKIAINFIYDNATDFKNGIALVEKSGISFYIDYLGEKIKKPKFKNEDENKAEIVNFKPLWYKKISNFFDKKLSDSFASVSYFRENEEDNFVKFKTKTAVVYEKQAAKDEQIEIKTVAKLFLLCKLAFFGSDKTIAQQDQFDTASKELGCAAISIVSNRPQTLNINLTKLNKITGEDIKKLKKLITENISEISGSSDTNTVYTKIIKDLEKDPGIVNIGMELSKELGIKDHKNWNVEQVERLKDKLKNSFFWVIQKMNNKNETLMIIPEFRKIAYENINDLDSVNIPKDRKKVENELTPDQPCTYKFLKIPDYLIIFKSAKWKLPS